MTNRNYPQRGNSYSRDDRYGYEQDQQNSGRRNKDNYEREFGNTNNAFYDDDDDPRYLNSGYSHERGHYRDYDEREESSYNNGGHRGNDRRRYDNEDDRDNYSRNEFGNRGQYRYNEQRVNRGYAETNYPGDRREGRMGYSDERSRWSQDEGSYRNDRNRNSGYSNSGRSNRNEGNYSDSNYDRDRRNYDDPDDRYGDRRNEYRDRRR